MPTSITTAPGRTKSPFTIRARPTATISTSARAHTSRRSRVREWHTVTVAFCASSSCAIGLPNRFERPTTTASAPSSCTPASAEHLHHAQRRRRPQPGTPERQQPGVDGGETVDVLLGADQRRQRRSVEVLGDGQLQQHAADRAVGVEALELLGDLLEGRVARAAASRTAPSRPRRTRAACRRRTPPRRDPRRRAPSRAPATRPTSRWKTSTSLATSARTRAAIALPSMIVALMGRCYAFAPGMETRVSAPAHRRVLGHQLSLRAIVGEAHDDHAAGLDAGDHAVAERRVHDVLAEAE